MGYLRAITILAISLIPGIYFFNYACGCLFQDPVTITVDSLQRLNQPPIILYPTGDPPINVTSTSTTQGSTIAYEYWYFWLPTRTHSANEWEPVYIYWDTSNPTSPILLAVETRFHFQWRQTAGTGLILNGTQPVITFGLQFGSVTWHVPVVRPTGLTSYLKPSNSSISFPYNTAGAIPPFTPGAWYYPVTNGGPHNINISVDPTAPPPAGPQAYENDTSGYAGPADPFSLYGTGKNYVNGFIFGGAATFLIYALLISFDIGIVRNLKRKR